MAVIYTSKHHSPEDPGGLIREILDMGPYFTGPAQDAFTSWLLRLGDEIDPAVAARSLLARYDLTAAPQPNDARGALIGLLREAAAYSRGRMEAHLCRPRGAHRRRRRRRRP